MAFKTIPSVLCTDERTREYLWYLSLQHTLLTNQLLTELPKQDGFEKWRKAGSVPRKAIESLGCDYRDKEHGGLPAKLFSSAVLSVSYTFESIFKTQNKRRAQCEGKQRWLGVAEQDLELAQASTFTSEAIRGEAAKILAQVETERQKDRDKKMKQGEKAQPSSLMDLLFKAWDRAKNPLRRRAIAHLLRNDCQVNPMEENPEKLGLRLEKKRISIQRLQEQLKAQLPIGRDPLGDRSEQFMARAIAFAAHDSYIPPEFWLKWHQSIQVSPLSEKEVSCSCWFLSWLCYHLQSAMEFESWEQDLPRQTANLSKNLKPQLYPILFASNDDLRWSWEADAPSENRDSVSASPDSPPPLSRKPSRRRTRKRQKRATPRISLSFKGLGDLRARLYCDRRQLPIFQQLVRESEANEQRKKEDKFSLALFPLRTACLFWEEDTQQGQKKNTWKLKNLWLKWCSSMSCSTQPGEQELEQWFNSLIYLCLSFRLPWNTHRLHLHHAIDVRLLTTEGTEEVRQEKLALVPKLLAGLQKVAEIQPKKRMSVKKREELLQKQKNCETVAKKNQTTLDRLHNNPPPSRPHRVAYLGNSDVVVKVAFSREHIVGVAVVNAKSQQTLEYCDVRSLLSDPRLDLLQQRSLKLHNQPERQRKAKLVDLEVKAVKSRRSRHKPRINLRQLQLQPYRLIRLWRRLRDKNSTLRQIEQQRGCYRASQAESNLALYLSRLIAKSIVALAQRWQAGSILLPEFGDLRESIESEIQAKAKQKYPDDNVELQKQYAKEFRISFHQWNYKNLSQCVRSCAARVEVLCVAGQQPRVGSLREKAIAVQIPPKPK